MKFSRTNVFEVEIVRAGYTFDGREFDLSDLTAIVQSFEELKLSGRVPVGLGHDRKDTEAAEGWIVALRLEDEVLTADVQIVREELIDEIKKGKWRNVSVELMRNVKRGKKEYAWVLMGLAILGAVPPAVQGLRPLNDSVASPVPNARCEGVLTFSRKIEDKKEDTSLQRENAKLVQQLIDAKFNAAIEAGKILPRDREAFRKRYGERATVPDAEAWIASSPRPQRSETRQTRQTEEQVQTYSRPDVELNARATKLQKDLKAEGEQIDLREATRRVMKADPELAKAYVRMPSDMAG